LLATFWVWGRSGVIEGIADWVRLKAGYAPPHWKRHTDCEWDAGYEKTGFFLEWLEEEHGSDVVRRINEALRECEYDAGKVWNGCCGKGVGELWDEYKKCEGEPEESEKEYEKCDEGPEEKQERKVQAPAEDGGHTAPEEDTRTAREKARRGGNMHIPVRPGASS